MHRWLESATALALDHEYEDIMSYRLCAIIVRGGSIISVGYNKRNSNSFVDYVRQNATPDKNYKMNVHAEMAAILSARNRCDLTGCKIFVARVKPSGIGCARPCDGCQFALKKYGIKRAFYTISDREFGVMKV